MSTFVFPDTTIRAKGNFNLIPIGKKMAKEILSEHAFSSTVKDQAVIALIESYLEVKLPDPQDSGFMRPGDKAIIVMMVVKKFKNNGKPPKVKPQAFLLRRER